MSDQPTILFLCVHNAGRSQMAAAFARQIGAWRVTVHSAGSAPGEQLNPAVVAAMAEVGLDISNESPQKLTDAMAIDADVIVTMGCGDAAMRRCGDAAMRAPTTRVSATRTGS